MEKKLKQIEKEVGLQDAFVSLLAGVLDKPLPYHSGKFHFGFRFAKPGPKHFCLLKAVRCVSGLNAAIALVRAGYPQELAVLIRTIVECTSYIEYVLASYDNGNIGTKEQKFLDEYFADFRRDEVADFKRPNVKQEDIHKSIGRYVDTAVGQSERADEFKGVSLKTLMSNVYLTYSNYVHSRYPETMDLYGGDPTRFHMHGMSGTPKDAENLEMLECFANGVSLTLRQMAQKFGLVEKLKNVPGLAEWYWTFLKSA